MSRAYCLTCNELVVETAGGTCPHGHPVAQEGHGPEPWVGFATESGAHRATAPYNGNGDRSSHDGGADLRTLERFEPPPPHRDPLPDASEHAVSAAPADDLSVLDDLAAWDLDDLVAPEDDGPAPSGSLDAPGAAPADGDGWDELATLAAELQLGSDVDDASAVADPEPHPPAPAPEAVTPPPPPAFEEAVPPPPPSAAAPVAPPPPPPTAPATELAEVWGEADLDVPSPVSPELDDAAPEAPAVDTPPVDVPAPSGPVDLRNFTARGARVGEDGKGGGPIWRRKR